MRYLKVEIFNLLTQRQREVMLAIAQQGEATNIQGAEFIKRYNLGTASMVSSATRTLLQKDLLTKDNNAYSIYDKYLTLWLRRRSQL